VKPGVHSVPAGPEHTDCGASGTSVTEVPFLGLAALTAEHGQLLQITSGSGFVCKEGEAPQRVRAGDTVWIAPNERHWHGATSSTLMSHTTTTIGATEFHEAVTEAEYAAANVTPRD
jgi:hypothetical protein